jgi:hypothetical protein
MGEWAMARVSGLLAALLISVVLSVQASGAPGQDQENPRNSGVWTLSREWRYGPWGDNTPDEGTINLDQAPTLERKKARVPCDRRLSKTFRIPESWKNRPIWLTYDAAGVAGADVSGIHLNGKRLEIALPFIPGKKGAPVPRPDVGEKKDEPTWFVEISKQCRMDGENTLSLRVTKWPVPASMGAWLYSPPKSERVLFLIDPGRVASDGVAITRYIDHVRGLFPVEPVVVQRSFAKPEELRAYLSETHTKTGISGAVLIGSHPVCAVPPGEAGGEEKALSHYYEALGVSEQKVRDLDNERLDIDIWVAWIRDIPGEPKALTAYLRKVNDYYEKRLCFPDRGMVVPDDGGECSSGLELYDLLSVPADLAYYSAHGGMSFRGGGPHNTLNIDEIRKTCPAAPVLRLYGCSAGNIYRPITPGEAFLFGHAVTQVVITHTMPQGGAIVSVPKGVYAELLEIAPHMGVAYQYFYDIRAHYPFSLIMLGNPFVKLGMGLSAPSGSIRGKVHLPGGQSSEGFYVSALKGEQYVGRVKTDARGEFCFACLPAGRHLLRLHVNALQTETQSIVVEAGKTVETGWRLDRLWVIRGRVLADKGTLPSATPPWVEMARNPVADEFTGNDLLAAIPNAQGQFEIVGSKPLTCWIRGCAGKRQRSKPISINAEPGRIVENVALKVPNPTP